MKMLIIEYLCMLFSPLPPHHWDDHITGILTVYSIAFAICSDTCSDTSLDTCADTSSDICLDICSDICSLLLAFPSPLERRRLRVAGVSAFAAFIDFIALSTFIAFFAGISFLACVDRCRLGGATALAILIAFNVMAMQLVRGLSTLRACARA